MRVIGRMDLNRALLARQLLLNRRDLDVRCAVESLVGLQAQVPNAPYVSLWSRLERFEPDDLSALVEEREVVRAPLMRATIHLVTARDCARLRPVLQSVFERSFGSSPFAKNLDGVDLGEVRQAGRALLAEPRTRAALGRALGERWPDRDPLSLAYAVTYLLPAVQMPPRGVWGKRSQATWVAAETWLGRRLEAGARVEEAVLRYLAAFGPATVQDVALWSGLTGVRDVVESLRPWLRTYRDEDGRELFDVEDGLLPDPESPAPPRFLPEFDNVLLSHADRSRIVEGGRNPPIPSGGGAGPALGTVLIDGFMCATWLLERGRGGDAARLVVTPFAQFGRRHEEAVCYEGERLLAFVAADAADRDVVLAVPAA